MLPSSNLRMFTLSLRMCIFTHIYTFICVSMYVFIWTGWWPHCCGPERLAAVPGQNLRTPGQKCMYSWLWHVWVMISCLFKSKCKLWYVSVCVRVHVQEISAMQFTQDIIRDFKRRTVESSLVSNGNYRQEKRTLYFHQKNGWVGWDTTVAHIWPSFNKLIDFSSWVFSLDNFQLSGEDGRGLWQKKLGCIQVSGCGSWLSWQKTCACWWSKQKVQPVMH